MAKKTAFKVQIKGFKEAAQVLGQLPTHLQKRIITKALKKSAVPLERAAIMEAPHASGVLRENIKIVVSTKGRKAPHAAAVLVKVHYRRRKGDNKKDDPFYFRFVHEGTKHISANPFFERAFESNETKPMALFSGELSKAVSQYVQRNFKPVKR